MHLEINGARIFVRTFGARTDGVPVVLVHGATVDGNTDWGALAPLLARNRFVVVPDCRGHGRSTNPRRTYDFAEMAGDIAALIRTLPGGRAHVVGHSNGGNVALVTLLEHPDIVATCVAQGANAYVSPDLVALGSTWSADRVEREAPAWRDEMIALHGRVHGKRYWRRLVEMTFAEIARAPAYTPDDLARVERPLLVIEGADDPVNAPTQHGRWIARHVPFAELWRPEATGHTVHGERPLEWVERVEDFWKRRGSDAADALWRLGRERYGDARETVYDVGVATERGSAAVVGTVLEAGQRDEIARVVEPWAVTTNLRILAETAAKAVVCSPVADIRETSDDRAPRLTQAVMGETVTRLEERGRWVRVRLDRDGYLGWIRGGSLHEPGDGDMAARGRLSVSADVALCHVTPRGPVVGRLPFGARLPLLARRGTWVALGTPTGERWWLEARDAAPDTASGPVSVSSSIERFVGFVGIPYLWGGRTPFGFDCSGLSQAFWETLGVVLPRDADRQFLAGEDAPGEREPGDLVFFRDQDGQDRVAHVAIAIDRHRILHAWGAAGCVALTDLRDVARADVRALGDALIGARRVRPLHAAEPR